MRTHLSRGALSCAALALFFAAALWSPSVVARPKGRGHNLPRSVWSEKQSEGQSAPQIAPPAGESLLYYGGPVIENPRVYAIWWGSMASVSSEFTNPTTGIGAFFDGVLDSLFIDSWAQYDTNLITQVGTNKGMAGTNQIIGRGNYAGAYALSPVPTGVISDAQIQTALEAAITAGTLPPNDANAVYAIFFSAAVSISLPDNGGTSCNDFGAYHDRTDVLGAAYLVVPNCNYGFLELCSVVSHELAEATTDLRPTPGSNPDYPQAWNDSQGNEAADICEFPGEGGLMPTEGATFAVQYIWDQRGGACVMTAHAANDFSVAVSPHAWKMAPGSTATIAVNTALVAGNAQPLTLSVKAPAGVTATLASSSLNSGDATTLTVTSAAQLRDVQVVVTAVSGAGATAWTHTASLLLNTAPVANDFSIAVTPSDQSVTIPGLATYQIQTAVTAGVAAPVALSVIGFPPGMIATFNPAVVTAGASSVLTLKTYEQPAGSYPFGVVGNASSTHVATASLELVTMPTDGGSGGGSSGGGSSGGGTSAGGGSGGGSSSVSTHSGCGSAPIGTLGLPILLAIAFAAARKRRRSA